VAPQYVKIKGTQDWTDMEYCDADFTKIGQDVECKVKSSRNIGDPDCILWRTTSGDGWAFNKVMDLNCHNWYTEIIVDREQIMI
jgi:hypothetical protein